MVRGAAPAWWVPSSSRRADARYGRGVTVDPLPILRACAREVGDAVAGTRHRGFSGERESQYVIDVVADDVATRILRGAGFRVISEESGVTGDGAYTVVVDPIDGSTNADRGIPFFSTSLAVMRGEELVAGLVMNHATGTCYEAQRGAGATRDGVTIRATTVTSVDHAVIAFSGLPSVHGGWAQFRALGAASLEACLVAEGSLDAFSVTRHTRLHPWDYLAGLLIAREAGGADADYDGGDLVTSSMAPRRPVLAATAALRDALVRAGLP